MKCTEMDGSWVECCLDDPPDNLNDLLHAYAWVGWPAEPDEPAACLYTPSGRGAPYGWVAYWRGEPCNVPMSPMMAYSFVVPKTTRKTYLDWLDNPQEQVGDWHVHQNEIHLRPRSDTIITEPCRATSSKIENNMVHTHPIQCYIHHRASQGWPSGNDLSVLFYHQIPFHVVLAKEGWYVVYQHICGHEVTTNIDIPAVSKKIADRWDFLWHINRNTNFTIFFIPRPKIEKGKIYLFFKR